MANLLQQSILGQHWEVRTSHVQDAGEFEVVTETEKFLDQLIVPSRGEPLLQMEWEQSFDDEGRWTGSQQICHRVFRGGSTHAVRSELWKHLLNYYPPDITYEKRTEFRTKKVCIYSKQKVSHNND